MITKRVLEVFLSIACSWLLYAAVTGQYGLLAGERAAIGFFVVLFFITLALNNIGLRPKKDN